MQPQPTHSLNAIGRRLSRRSIIKAAIVLTAVAVALLPFPAAWVERYYTNGIFSTLQSWLTPLTNRVPFAVIDLLIIALAVALPAWWAAGLWRARRGSLKRASLNLAINTIVIAAVSLLSFQLLWGFNYMRPPLSAKLEYDAQRLNADAVKRLKILAAEQLNALSDQAHEGHWPDESEWRDRLHASFDSVVKHLGNRNGIAQAVPKKSLFEFYLAAAGISGFVNPYGEEVVLDSKLFPFEQPFSLAHEWAHLAGFANEAEASFVGLLACLQSDMPELRYSGWLALYMHTPWLWERATEQSGATSEARPPRLKPEVIADLEAINERARARMNPTVSRAQSEIYDRFLKANRVSEGIASYGMLVNLVVGTSFGNDWVPLRRSDS